MFNFDKAFEEMKAEQVNKKIQKDKTLKAVSLCIVAVIALIILLCSTTTIKAGHTGVITTFGKVSSNVLDEGFHFKAPWQRVTKVDNRVVKFTVNTETSTKDSQKIISTITINYRINFDQSYSIIKNIGKQYEEIVIEPNVNEAFKVITSLYTADECVVKRDMVAEQVKDKINQLLNGYGISVESINIDNTFDETYQAAINEKQVAEQQLKKAQIEKEAAIVNSQAKAESQLIEAEAKAKANEILNESLSDKVIAYNQVEKWDGKLPQVVGSDATITDFPTSDSN